MIQTIKGKGVVTGKAATALQCALAKPKADPDKVKKFREALEFHRGVKVIE